MKNEHYCSRQKTPYLYVKDGLFRMLKSFVKTDILLKDRSLCSHMRLCCQ